MTERSVADLARDAAEVTVKLEKARWQAAVLREVARLETAVMDMMDSSKDMGVAREKHGAARGEICRLLGSGAVSVIEGWQAAQEGESK